MDYAAFVRSAERAQLPPLVLVHGGDAQLVDDALAAATRGLFADPTLVAFGREVVDARDVPAEDIVRSAMTLPLMTAVRLVVVRHAQELAAKAATVIGEYTANPNPSTCLLLLADELLAGGRDGKPHWLLRAVPASGVVTLPARRGRALEEWLRQRAAADGITVSEDAARLLVEWVGDDTAALLGEVRKAALAGAAVGTAGANRQVGKREVEAVVGEHRLAGVFDLTRAIERRDVGLALRTLERLLVSEEPMRLLALLTSETRMAWLVHELTRRGQPAEQIARTLRRPAGVISARLAALGGASAATLRAKLQRCWEVERRLKSGGQVKAELAALVAELSSGRR
ncbi:MAG: DNA polymerase III subunit delta [Candidatus Rokubacteria bacterium]|nr:DNA polymerase III subunit delta [Candidatus Rokubacteria bacterium]